MIKPQRLEPGSTIGVIAPGSPVDEIKLKKGAEYLKELGFGIKFGKHLFAKCGYLAGSDENRLEDLHKMFADPDVSAIILARGGYGAFRLLESVDYNLIKNNPKVFVGYSDATALQWAILKYSGLVTFSGPMVAPDFGSEKVSELSTRHFLSVISGKEEYSDLAGYSAGQLESFNPGKASGLVLTGCLSIIAGIIGTPFCPELGGAMLVVEDIGEEPYRLDRLFATLQLHGVFEKISGLVLGAFEDCGPDKEETLRNVIIPIAQKYSIPVLANLQYGHINDKLTVPNGVLAEIDTDSLSFVLKEKPVN